MRTCIASELNKTVNGIISLLGIMYLIYFECILDLNQNTCSMSDIKWHFLRLCLEENATGKQQKRLPSQVGQFVLNNELLVSTEHMLRSSMLFFIDVLVQVRSNI